jgi:hypothetical protein
VALLSDRSATIRFSLAFSSSSWRRRFISEGISPANNFSLYELNFGKAIPHFKRYNNMTSVWSAAAWKDSIRSTYARLNKARLGSPALRSQQNYFLADKSLGGWNNDIFAVAKIQAPGVSVHQQDVVFAFVNNNFRGNAARSATFNVSATNSNGSNWFGIQANKTYNVVDLASINPVPSSFGSMRSMTATSWGPVRASSSPAWPSAA